MNGKGARVKTDEGYYIFVPNDIHYDVVCPCCNTELETRPERNVKDGRTVRKRSLNMKKLFISVPMRGRTEENIKKSVEDMHKLAEIMFGEELEVIDSFMGEQAPKCEREALWHLGNSISIMSQADCFIGVRYAEMFYGCRIESEVASLYEIPAININIEQLNSLRDCEEIGRKLWEEQAKCEAVANGR